MNEKQPEQQPEQKNSEEEKEPKKRGYFYTFGTVKRTGSKIKRNAPCFCGSGKKYKKCCLAEDPMAGMGPAQRAYIAEMIRRQQQGGNR